MEQIEEDEQHGDSGSDSDSEDSNYEPFMTFRRMGEEWDKYIFSFLSSKSRQMIRGVCKQWKNLVDEMSCAVINNGNYQRTTQLTDLYIVKVQNLTTELQAAAIMFKHTIRRLEFFNITVSYNLFHILQECARVQQLTFVNVILDTDKKMRCPEALTLPDVQVVTFRTKWSLQFTIHELILFDFLRQIKFERLEQVMIQWYGNSLRTVDDHTMYVFENTYSFPAPELPFGIKSTGLFELLLENRQTVKSFRQMTESHHLSPFGSPMIAEEFSDQIDTLQFEKFQCLVQNLTGNEHLVIGCQRNLREIEVNVLCDCWPALARAIESSSPTLISATINIYFELDPYNRRDINGLVHIPAEWQSKDASVFKDCTSLESLDWMTGTSALNMAALPDSIRTLHLFAPLTHENLLAIASKLRNLQNVSLFQLSLDRNDVVFFDNEIILGFVGIVTLEELDADGFNGNIDEISNYAKSQAVFDIYFHYYDNPNYGCLTITKAVSPSETLI